MRRIGWVLVAGWLAVLSTAGVGHAASAGGDAPTRTAYLAERLRENPVYVTDQLPRAVPRSTAPEFAEEARRLGVPTYVIVLPSEVDMGSDALLAGVHDRLGRKGLYVSLDESGLTDVQTYGVSVPGAQDARRTTMYESPYDATAHEEFRYFVDVLKSGQAAQRAKAAEKEYGGAYPAHEPANWHTTQTDREDQSFGTGVVVAGVPLLALLVTVSLRRHRDTRRRTVAVAALALSGVLAFTASQIFDDTTTGDGSYPTVADMRARIDRVAAGLRRDPLYVDPESPPVLDAAARARLRKRLGALHLPVVIAALPTPMDDESRGSADLLAKSLHDRLHRSALIVLADPASGMIDTFNYGARIDGGYLFDRPHDLSYAESSARPGADLGSRLDKLLGYVAKTPPAKPNSEVAPTPAPDPKQDLTLPGLFTGDFKPGLFIGTVLAALLFGLVAAVAALVRRIRRRGGHQADAPDRPSQSWLRQTAARELDALGKAVDPAGAPSAKQERRAWECLDAAVLLLDGDSDARIDADASPADLVCAIVLARAGLAAARDALPTQHVCHRNPLHGPARKVRPAGRKGRVSPVCEACRATPGTVLRLRPTASSGSGSAVPYPTLPGPLAVLGDGAGIDQLTREIREHYGVH
ncbi:hypothetical protein [Streptomyces gilvosporeus]|uniref:hypothetical protein n=1 Tax=Streptomyces gilvosporeus TaxID=553510 RepID=UPI001F198181|nr:hypothetical protein [Streptomyces gilvosporeus]